MKSIREKAEEYGKANLTAWGVISTERVEGFEAGANYVLDEIEEIINHPLRFVTSDKTIEEGMIEEISKLVERLKEK